MSKAFSDLVDPIAAAIFAKYKERYGTEVSRPYLGMSAIGKPCARALWYEFRHTKKSEFTGRMYRLFQTGHLAEPRFIQDLRSIGMGVWDVDPSTRRQFEFKDATLGGHFSGHADGVGNNLPTAPAHPCILEFKTHSAKSFAKLSSEGVEKAKPEHFAQMQCYMHYSMEQWGDNGCPHALYVAVNKDDDDLYTERVKYDREKALAYVARAKAIIFSPEPPPRIGKDATWFECKFCNFIDICHGKELPRAGCRTCAHSTPQKDGNAQWKCEKYSDLLLTDAQAKGCKSHVYIPILLQAHGEAIDSDEGSVTYRKPDGQMFINGDGGTPSAALLEALK